MSCTTHPDGGEIVYNEEQRAIQHINGSKITNLIINTSGYDNMTVFPKYRKLLLDFSTSNEYYFVHDLDQLALNPIDDEIEKEDPSWTLCSRITFDSYNDKYVVLIGEHIFPTISVDIIDVSNSMIYSGEVHNGFCKGDREDEEDKDEGEGEGEGDEDKEDQDNDDKIYQNTMETDELDDLYECNISVDNTGKIKFSVVNIETDEVVHNQIIKWNSDNETLDGIHLTPYTSKEEWNKGALPP